jgi:hypothetical protein
MFVSSDAIDAALNETVEHRRGLRVVAGGVLAEPLEGRPPGTPYVLLEARTLRDAESGEACFDDIAGRSPLAWEHGWRGPPAAHAAAGWLLALELFADADQIGRLHDDATP